MNLEQPSDMARRSTNTNSHVTIFDVALEARVSISTVSRVLNDSAAVSTSTRERVRAAVRSLKYQPDRAARSLASKNRSTLAVALPSATSLFFVEVLKGVKEVLRERDMDLLLGNLGSADPEATLHRFLERGAVDALLLIALRVDNELGEELEQLKSQVVLVGAAHPAFDSFEWDGEAGAQRAVEHLINLGHQRIGMIAAQPWGAGAPARLRGYQAALETAGIAFDPRLVASGETTKHAGYSEEAGAEALLQLLAQDAPPTAIFASSDVQAYGARSAARDRGLLIPRDLSLVGYDNLKLSRFLDLTTVDQSMQDIGHQATERLLLRLDGREAPVTHELISPPLIVRGSTAPVTS